MNGKLITCEDFKPANIILKPPMGAFSEIWYLTEVDGKSVAVRPVFKTPRLPVKFGAKKFSTDTSYGYCLNMYNKDIDPETGEFFQLVKSVDRALIAAYTENHKQWPVKPTTCMKYRTAMKRKTVNDDLYFQVKLVHAVKGGPPASVIYDSNRQKVGPEEITYGKYADQFICPAYLYYDDTGIHPVWQSHQIVLSSVEKVFLEECILDHVFKVPQQMTYLPVPVQVKSQIVPVPPPPPPLPPMPKIVINQTQLTNAIRGLKKIKIEEPASDED